MRAFAGHRTLRPGGRSVPNLQSSRQPSKTMAMQVYQQGNAMRHNYFVAAMPAVAIGTIVVASVDRVGGF